MTGARDGDFHPSPISDADHTAPLPGSFRQPVYFQRIPAGAGRSVAVVLASYAEVP
jgi:hypothetical protein